MTDTRPFFHRVSTRQFNELKRSNAAWEDIDRMYRQPRWCTYPDALHGGAGCWSLVGRKIKKRADCGECECAV